jgi:hypothetical protein
MMAVMIPCGVPLGNMGSARLKRAAPECLGDGVSVCGQSARRLRSLDGSAIWAGQVCNPVVDAFPAKTDPDSNDEGRGLKFPSTTWGSWKWPKAAT